MAKAGAADYCRRPFTVYLTPDELAAARELAWQEHQPLSRWASSILADAINRRVRADRAAAASGQLDITTTTARKGARR